jgi:hypothetical protein
VRRAGGLLSLDPDCPGGPCVVDETVRTCGPPASALLGPVEAVAQIDAKPCVSQVMPGCPLRLIARLEALCHKVALEPAA